MMFSNLVTERVHLGLQIGTAEPLIGTEVGWKSGRPRAVSLAFCRVLASELEG